MGKCFGDVMKLFDDEVTGTKQYEIDDDRFFDKFDTPEQYADRKIRMLRDDMYIVLTEEEIAHLKTLKTETAINAAVRSIISRHWA